MTAMPPPLSAPLNLPCQLSPASFIPENNQDLSDEITRLAGHINAAQYRFLKLLAVLIERDAWGGDSGMKSPAHWLNYYCGIALGAAREKVRVAKSLQALPKIDQAFSSGAISYSKVRAMTRSATASNEEYLLEIARHGTAHHVEALVKKYQSSERSLRLDESRNEAEESSTQYGSRDFSWYYDDNGMLVFSGKLAPEDGAVFLQAIEAVFKTVFDKKARSAEAPARAEAIAKNADQQQKLQQKSSKSVPAGTFFPEPDKLAVNLVEEAIDVTSPGQKRAEALVFMSEHLLSTINQADPSAGLQALSGGDKYQLMIHIDSHSQSVSSSSQQPSHCYINNGPFLSTATTRRLACDASQVTVVEDSKGKILNIGRKTRTIPPAIRRALTVRDGGCRFPGCCETRYVDAHHIQHWCDGGKTSLENLLLVCRHHHRLIHHEGYAIVIGSQQDFVFVRPDGSKLEQSIYPQFVGLGSQESESRALELQHQELGLEISAKTAVSRWRGEPMDYGMAVESLLGMRM